MKKNKNLCFMSIFYLLIAFQCIGCGLLHSFDIYNNTNKTIIVNYREDGSNYTDERFEVGPHQKKEDFSGGFSNEKRKVSYFLDYVKVTKVDGTTLLDLKGDSLDTHFKRVKDWSILYRLEVN